MFGHILFLLDSFLEIGNRNCCRDNKDTVFFHTCSLWDQKFQEFDFEFGILITVITVQLITTL